MCWNVLWLQRNCSFRGHLWRAVTLQPFRLFVPTPSNGCRVTPPRGDCSGEQSLCSQTGMFAASPPKRLRVSASRGEAENEESVSRVPAGSPPGILCCLLCFSTPRISHHVHPSDHQQSEFPKSAFPTFGISKFPRFRISEFPNFRVSELPNFRISELPNFRVAEFPNF